MPTSQSWTPETRRTIAVITNFKMEVGDDYYEFCVGISQREEGKWCNMGHRRSLDKIHTILAHKDDRFGRQACQGLHKRGGTIPWDSSVHCLRSRSQVHLLTMVDHRTCPRDKIGYEHYISPLNWWPVGKSNPSLGGPITGMCTRIWRKLGGTYNISEVHI